MQHSIFYFVCSSNYRNVVSANKKRSSIITLSTDDHYFHFGIWKNHNLGIEINLKVAKVLLKIH